MSENKYAIIDTNKNIKDLQLDYLNERDEEGYLEYCNFLFEENIIAMSLSLIHICGSNDGAGDSEKGYICRGGRMLNEETYENLWELFSSIPSLDMPGKSVTEEILNFDHLHPTQMCIRDRFYDYFYIIF